MCVCLYVYVHVLLLLTDLDAIELFAWVLLSILRKRGRFMVLFPAVKMGGWEMLVPSECIILKAINAGLQFKSFSRGR